MSCSVLLCLGELVVFLGVEVVGPGVLLDESFGSLPDPVIIDANLRLVPHHLDLFH